MTDAEILANRRKVIAFLKNPKRRKDESYLDVGHGRRCCLGHMCFALGIKRRKLTDSAGASPEEALAGKRYVYGKRGELYLAPQELISAVGLYDDQGRSINITVGTPLWGVTNVAPELYATDMKRFNEVDDELAAR